MMRRLFLFFTIIILFTACGEGRRGDVPRNVSTISHADNLMRYANNVTLSAIDSGYLVTVRNPWDTVASLGQFLINRPFQKVVCFSATQWSAYIELGEVDRVGGIIEGRYVNDSAMLALLDEGTVRDLGTEAQIDLERLMVLQPDVILYNPYSGIDVPWNVSLLPNTVMFPYADYLENTPLGRAEWIRIVGVLCGRQEEADAWFDAIERRYLSLKALCETVEERPTVFSDFPFNGQWYVAGGQSYIAQLFADAGADYLWSDNDKAGSIPLDAESILAKAQHADFWRVANSTHAEMTYGSLKHQNPLFPLFDAFKNHKIMVCDIIPTGYFEHSQMEPDLLLADFIWFFHPELLTGEWEGYQPKYYHWMKP